MLYQSQVNPLFDGPYAYALRNRIQGPGRNQASAGPGAMPAPAPMPAQQTQQGGAMGGGGGINPLQAANMAMKFNTPASGAGAASSSSAPLASAAPAAQASGAGTSGAGGASGAGASGAGLAGSAWMLPVAAAAVASGVALHEGEDWKDVFGGKGWGAYPFKSAEALGNGDFRGAIGQSLKGGGGPVAMMGDAVMGGNSEDYLHSALGPVKGLWDYFTGDDDDTMDLISAIGNAWG